MSIADEMKKLTEDIIASHDMRVKALSGLVADTRKVLGEAQKTVKTFAEDRENMASIQAKSLSDFVRDLSKEVGNKLKDFQAKLKEMSADRLKMSDKLKKELAKDAKDLTDYVKDKLEEFSGAREEMSAALRKDLKKAIEDISDSVEDILDGSRKLTGEYRADMDKARSVWQGMASGMGKARKTGGVPEVRTGGKMTEIKKSAAKKRKGSKKRKK